jgi:arylsulfatase A-like enzyme
MMLAAATMTMAALSSTNPPAKPNVVFILADDWGYGDVGAYKTLLSNGVDAVCLFFPL